MLSGTPLIALYHLDDVGAHIMTLVILHSRDTTSVTAFNPRNEKLWSGPYGGLMTLDLRRFGPDSIEVTDWRQVMSDIITIHEDFTVTIKASDEVDNAIIRSSEIVEIALNTYSMAINSGNLK